jgi:O-acetyl-ADP-ribose deacetylase
MQVLAIKADIASRNVDVVVNAANPGLRGGGGVDGAIHRAAGPQLFRECSELQGCHTGQCVVTPGFALKAKWIIHTVGPDFRQLRDHNPTLADELLVLCYSNCLRTAARLGAKSIALPQISTGAYAFPFERAGPLAVQTVVSCAAALPLERIELICFADSELQRYKSLLAGAHPSD